MRWFVAMLAACTPAPRAPADAPAKLRVVRCEPALPLPTWGGPSGSRVASLFGVGGGGSGRIANPPAGSIAFGRPEIRGELDATGLTDAIARVSDRILHCYAPHLAADPELAMIARLDLLVDPDGQVAAAKAVGWQREVLACTLDIVRRVAMPKPPRDPVMATIAIAFRPKPSTDEVVYLPAKVGPWTPFATTEAFPSPGTQIGPATEAALRPWLPVLDACAARSRTTGSLRAVASVDAGGVISEARVGGLGDRELEACVARVFEGIRVVVPTAGTEVACDLSRGDAQPWRLTPGPDYETLDVSRTQIRHGTDVLDDAHAEGLPRERGYLVIADADAPAKRVTAAVGYATISDPVMIGIRDRDGVAFVGIAGGDATEGSLVVEVHRQSIDACRLGDPATTVATAKAGDLGAVDQLMKALVAACGKPRCEQTILVAADPDAAAGDLLVVAGAARRVGIPRLLLASPTTCTAK